jgi:hypothetical protein
MSSPTFAHSTRNAKPCWIGKSRNRGQPDSEIWVSDGGKGAVDGSLAKTGNTSAEMAEFQNKVLAARLARSQAADDIAKTSNTEGALADFESRLVAARLARHGATEDVAKTSNVSAVEPDSNLSEAVSSLPKTETAASVIVRPNDTSTTISNISGNTPSATPDAPQRTPESVPMGTREPGTATGDVSLRLIDMLESTSVAEKEAAQAAAKTGNLGSAEAGAKTGNLNGTGGSMAAALARLHEAQLAGEASGRDFITAWKAKHAKPLLVLPFVWLNVP